MNRIVGMMFWLFMTPAYVLGQTVVLVDVDQLANAQHTLFTLDYDGKTYEWSADIPLGVDPAAYLITQADKYMSDIYRKMYRQAPNDLHSVAQWDAWVVAGTMDSKGKIVNKKPFTGKHPKSIQLKKDIDAATSIPDLKIIIKKMLGE